MSEKKVSRRKFIAAGGAVVAAAAIGGAAYYLSNLPTPPPTLTTTATASSASSSTPSGPVQLKMLTADWSPVPALSDPTMIPKAFSDFTGGQITVNVETSPWETFWEKSALEWSNGSPSYDVFGADSLQFPTVAANDYFYDLSQWPQQQGLDPIRWDLLSKSSYNFLQYGGKTWGIPMLESCVLLACRQDLLEKGGLKVPTNWDEYLHVAEQLNSPAQGVYGTALHGGLFEACIGANWLPRLVGTTPPTGDLDGFLFDSQGKPLFEQTGVRPLQLMQSVLPFAPPGTIAWSYPEVSAGVRTGKVAMVMDFTDDTFGYETGSDSVVAGKMVYAPLPKEDGAKQTIVSPVCFMGVNKQSKHPVEAYKFLQWMVNQGAAYQLFANAMPLVSPYLPVRQKLPQQYAKVYDTLNGEFFVPYHFWEKNSLEVLQKIYEPVSLALSGKMTPQEAMKRAAADAAATVKILPKQ
jgi:multiple sugar transport system substrate-binding protein